MIKEQMNFPTSYESGTSFENVDQIDIHAAREGLSTIDEAHQLIEDTNERARVAVEQAPLGLHEYIGQLGLRVVSVRRNRIEMLNRSDVDKAA